MAGLFVAVVALFGRTDGENFWVERAHDLDGGIGRGDVRVPADVVILQDVVPEWIAVLRAEPAAPIVAVAAELGGAGLGIEFAGVRTKTKIAAAERNFCAG